MAGPPPPPPPAGPEAPRYQEWILDTIDSLRSRKARPDLERICRMVRRRHGPEPERTRAELEKLIQQRAVLRVSYKGSISYRNAARVQPPRRPPAPPPPPPPPPGPPPPPPPGPPAARRAAEPPVSLRDAARYLGGDGRLTRGRLQGSALPADGGPGPGGGGGGGGGGGSGPGSGAGAGPGGRLERTRLATIAMARAERGRGAAGRARKPPKSGTDKEEDEEEEEEEEDGTASEASEGSEDGAVAPPRALNGECRGGPGLPGGPGRGGPPPGRRSPEPHRLPKACSPGESACPNLEGAFGQPDRAVSPALAGAEPSVPLSPGRPGVQAADGAPFSCTATKKEKAADPVEWTVRDVVDYFTEAGFPEQATAFQEQEIDGKSLLLMQRADVLTGLSIRLGPALKIYEYHVKLLQRSHFEEDEGPEAFLG
ncbi:sterile alpha motif domain-containing protein 1-like [Struthio camelus]|uniref:sterile alpha motif domain-containing protein 1-like n=1 Tax=Struthio camelus TaxID=8801 RepID=UPI003603C1C7